MEKLITKEYFNKKTVYPKEEFTFKIYSIFLFTRQNYILNLKQQTFSHQNSKNRIHFDNNKKASKRDFLSF